MNTIDNEKYLSRDFSEMDNLRLRCISLMRKYKEKNNFIKAQFCVHRSAPLTKVQCDKIMEICSKIKEKEKNGERVEKYLY